LAKHMSDLQKRWEADLFDSRQLLGRHGFRESVPNETSRRDGEYAVLADEYVRRSLGSRTPVRDVATKYGLEATQVRDLLQEARRRDLLTRPGRGRAGGTLTDRGRNALASADRTQATKRWARRER
jgi:hypothetical protein